MLLEMHPARVLLPVLALLSVRCTGGEPSGFTGSSASQVTNPQSSFTSDPGTTTDTGTTGSTGSTGSTAVDPTTGTAATDAGSTSSASSSSSSTSTTAGVCGDGVVDPGELCDDGNRDDADACLGDCTAGQALLVLAGRGTNPPLAARYVPGPGWSTGQLDAGLGETALVATPAGALAAGRRVSGDPDLDMELVFTTWSPGQPDAWTALAPVGVFGFAEDGPGLAAVGDTATLAFLGTDFKHYTARHSGGAWGPFLPLPAANPPDQAFGPSAAVLAGGVAETYAAYAGDDSKIYYSLRPTPDGAWKPSQQAPPPVVVSALTPSALVDPMGDLLLAYVREADGKIAVVKLLTAQNAWTLETVVHDQAVAGSELAFVRTDAGAYYLAWKGYDNDGIYAARGLDHDDWGVPFTVAEPQTATLPPALARGAVGADAELLYVTNKILHHARLVAEDPGVPAEVPGADGLTARPAAVRVQLAP